MLSLENLSNEFFEEIYVNDSGRYNQIISKVNLDEIDSAIRGIESRLRKLRDIEIGKEDFFVTSFQDLLEQYTSAVDYIVYFVIFIALISVLVSAIKTANTTITSVLERVKEIGIMKAIGAKNREVFEIFVFESGFLGFVAISGACLIKIIVFPSLFNFESNFITCSPVLVSKFPVGSSARIISGSLASALAIATLCYWPSLN